MLMMMVKLKQPMEKEKKSGIGNLKLLEVQMDSTMERW